MILQPSYPPTPSYHLPLILTGHLLKIFYFAIHAANISIIYYKCKEINLLEVKSVLFLNSILFFIEI